MTRAERIHEKLMTAFHPETLNVIDESAEHFGHGGYAAEGSHFAVEIQASILKDKKMLEAHRLIYDALKEMMPSEIHALRIKLL